MVTTGTSQPRDKAGLGNPETGIRAVLFDFGGVLSTSPFAAFGRYEAQMDLPPDSIRGLNAKDHDTNAWARLERGELTLEGFREVFEAEAREAGHDIDAGEVLRLLSGDLRPAMIEVVRRCRERYLVALATNNFVQSDAASFSPARNDVMSLFDEVIESSKIGSRKPEASFFHACCTRLAIAPHEAAFIDDLGVNLKPARQLGMTTIKFVSEEQAIADLETLLQLKLT